MAVVVRGSGSGIQQVVVMVVEVVMIVVVKTVVSGSDCGSGGDCDSRRSTVSWRTM